MENNKVLDNKEIKLSFIIFNNLLYYKYKIIKIL